MGINTIVFIPRLYSIWRMTEIDKQIQADYKNRINRVFEFIDQNLESDLSLKRISEIAFFCYYFSLFGEIQTYPKNPD